MEQTVGLAGLGSIGLTIARGLDSGIPGLKLVSAASADPEGSREALKKFARPPLFGSLNAITKADIVVEALPPTIFDQIAVPAIEAGRIFIPCSVGALLRHWELVDRAKATGARIIVPSGAIGGLDALRAIARGPVRSVILESRKPASGLSKIPYIEARGIDVGALSEPTKVFEGDAFDASKHFPMNANVAAAVALAGIGPSRTQVEIWVDPYISRNVHTLRVDSPSAALEVKIENVPSDQNPRTSQLAGLSILACLEGLVGAIRVGS